LEDSSWQIVADKVQLEMDMDFDHFVKKPQMGIGFHTPGKKITHFGLK